RGLISTRSSSSWAWIWPIWRTRSTKGPRSSDGMPACAATSPAWKELRPRRGSILTRPIRSGLEAATSSMSSSLSDEDMCTEVELLADGDRLLHQEPVYPIPSNLLGQKLAGGGLGPFG